MLCLTLLVVVALRSAAALESIRSQTSLTFQDYVVQFQRSFHDSSEYAERQALFSKRLEFIRAHNSDPKRLWTAGINHFTDRTDAEFELLQGWRGQHGEAGNSVAVALIEEQSEHIWAPPVVEWSNLSAVADSAMDQGSCGSCWAMAAATMMEGRYEAQTRGKRSFSAQQLVNCVKNPLECGGTGGCSGATVELALNYIQSHGLRSNEDVPYVGEDRSCADAEQPQSALLALGHVNGQSVHLSGYRTLPSNKALPLMHSLTKGPVAISVGASDWMVYSSGIFNGCVKDIVINHAVTLIGYGEEAGVHYWTVQNSWGTYWGEGGKIRLFRHPHPKGDEGYCGTDYHPDEGVSCKPYPEKVRVCGMCGLLYDAVEANFEKQGLLATGRKGQGQGRRNLKKQKKQK
eukprot:CAMPEP_0170607388 /NCGR_PEP_ID=MMETSP0224-20130122/21026_1 /TAXON_ID=285029 /ORGANISM="Togula jolla, Strain CCCM 725" /LENGTH=402 /DNA_ID=CAMNT_0010932547 /DNA_START=83 /DNA_END=1291 /DNA_ORIENTATION=+